MPRHRKKKIKITKSDLKLFVVMCLIALIVGAGIVLVDEKSRALLETFKESAMADVKQQAELYKAKIMEKKKAQDGR